jgi:hypothetical protein
MSETNFRELIGEERAVGFDQVGITVRLWGEHPLLEPWGSQKPRDDQLPHL